MHSAKDILAFATLVASLPRRWQYIKKTFPSPYCLLRDENGHCPIVSVYNYLENCSPRESRALCNIEAGSYWVHLRDRLKINLTTSAIMSAADRKEHKLDTPSCALRMQIRKALIKALVEAGKLPALAPKETPPCPSTKTPSQSSATFGSTLSSKRTSQATTTTVAVSI